jgi:hypothetical protein
VTVQRLCRLHDIGRTVGRQVVLTDADLEQLAARFNGQAGNPNWRPAEPPAPAARPSKRSASAARPSKAKRSRSK